MMPRSFTSWYLASLIAIATLASSTVVAQRRCWIEFRDKGPAVASYRVSAEREALARLSPKCLARRRSEGKGIAEADLRINPAYLDSIGAIGITPIHVSRWTNSVSAELTDQQITRLRTQSHVRSVHPVNSSTSLARQAAESVLCTYDPVISSAGQSVLQLLHINVLPLMAMGLDATNVRLGFMDTGFRWRSMSSLSHAHVDREYDYVFKDSVTGNEDVDVPDQDGHGSSTLSTAIGIEPGIHASAAFGATMFLAKTEDLRSETNHEEDNMAQALEDMEAWGVDVTSCSLGYRTFDDPSQSYTYDDLNGRTSISARAVQRAAELGVIVVTAMGNNGDQPDPYLLTPADADSILSAGGLDETGERATFSSLGPTADHRIKPDICAPAVSVHGQAADGHFDFFGGTSYSTPLISSACCLIRQAHPGATAAAIRNAVHATGSNAAHPDTLTGWGAINAYAAALEVGDVMHEMNASYDTQLELCVGLASKFGITNAYIEYSTRSDGTRTRPLFLVADSLIYSTQIALQTNVEVDYRYVLTNGSGGVSYLPDTGYYRFNTGSGHELVIDAYPNPVHGSETLAVSEPGEWQLYDEAGRIVRSGRIVIPGEQSFIVSDLSSGSYFVVFRATNGEVATHKIFVLH